MEREIQDLTEQPEDGHSGTREQLLALAHERVQISGYAGLHFGDLAEALSVSRAAIHYHFASKLQLGCEVIGEYVVWTRNQLAAIDATSIDRRHKLSSYVDMYRKTLGPAADRLCPGGVLAAEAATLPAELRSLVREFFELHIDWVAREIFADQKHDEAVRNATTLVASLQGSLVLARLMGDVGQLDNVERATLHAIAIP